MQEKHDICPDIVLSFLRVPNGIFLEYLSGGSLEHRLRTTQCRTVTDQLGSKSPKPSLHR
ncbi:hypothetical protein BDW60DRAFT_195972 [Aspergillus nidulans var. acristatus]